MIPIGKNFIAEQKEAPAASGLLFIPLAARRRPNRAVIVALSEELKKNCKWLREGDTVCFKQGSGYPIGGADGRMFLILDTKSVLSYEGIHP